MGRRVTNFTTYREIDLRDGRDIISTCEVRYTFTIGQAIPSRNWTNASDGNFYPAERPQVDVTKVEVRQGSGRWHEADGILWDILCSDIPDQWFLEQAEESAE